MKARFEGTEGRRLLIEELKRQRIVAGDEALATEIAMHAELRQVEAGEEIIREGGADNDIFFIVSGSFDTIIRGRRVAQRGPGNSIGEMAAVQASEPRSATVKAIETSVLCVLSEPQLNAIGNKYAEIYRRLSQELARRLLEGNTLVPSASKSVRILILSSLKGLPVARTIETLFEYEPFMVQVWRSGFFLETGYSLENLERELESADFGIVIASSADVMASNGTHLKAPREAAVFELGLLIGKLGRHRTLLLEPGEKDADLSPNASSVATLSYPSPEPSGLLTTMRPTYHQLSEHIKQFGPRN